MNNGCSWESYTAQLFKNLDLLKRRRTYLRGDYSLRSRSDIVHYLNDTLQDVGYMVGRARQDYVLHASRALYSNIDDTDSASEEMDDTGYAQEEDIDTILSRVVSNVQDAKCVLGNAHAHAQRIERSLRRRINRFEAVSVNKALEHMYQALEALASLLYDGEEQETSPIYHTLEDAVATLATAINVLQVAVVRGALRSLFERDSTLRNLSPLDRVFIHMSAMGARRAAHIIASCLMFCIPPSLDSSTKAEDYYEAMHSYIRSLISIALLVSEDVPAAKFRSTASAIATARFRAAKRKLTSITHKMCSHLGTTEKLCSEANEKIYEYFPVDTVNFTIFFNVVSIACHACDIFEHAADAYSKYSLGTYDDSTWNVFSPFQCSSVILNLMEAISYVQSMLHMLNIVRENVAESFKNEERRFSLTSYISNTFTLMDISQAIKAAESAMRHLRSAMYIVGYMGGKSAIERYLKCVKEYRENGRSITTQDAYLCSRMYNIGVHMLYACRELYDFCDLRFSLEWCTGINVVDRDMHRTFLSCARIFDALFYEGYYNQYIWDGRFESAQLVFPGELPGKVPMYSIFHRIPEIRFSCDMLDDVLNVDAVFRPVTQNAGELRSIYEYGKRKHSLPSGDSFSVGNVVQCAKEWLCSSCPSSLLSAASITRTFLQNVGTFITDVYALLQVGSRERGR